MSNLPENVIEILKLKKHREQVRKAVKICRDKKKQNGEYKQESHYYSIPNESYRYKDNALLAVKRLFGTCHLI